MADKHEYPNQHPLKAMANDALANKGPTARQRYQSPRLVHYGSIAALTASGSGAMSENGVGRQCGMGNPMRMVNPLCP